MLQKGQTSELQGFLGLAKHTKWISFKWGTDDQVILREFNIILFSNSCQIPLSQTLLFEIS